MHQRIYAERSARAQARIVAAAAELGNRFGLADAAGRIATIQSNQPHLKVLFEREAVADLLEALGTAGEDAPSLSDLTVPDLKAMAAERGIDGASNMKKADLISALEKSE